MNSKSRKKRKVKDYQFKNKLERKQANKKERQELIKVLKAEEERLDKEFKARTQFTSIDLSVKATI